MFSCRTYRPGDLLTSRAQGSEKALIVLNTPLMSRETLETLWSSCSWRICADGGANRLHDMWEGYEEPSRNKYVSGPSNMMHGDHACQGVAE